MHQLFSTNVAIGVPIGVPNSVTISFATVTTIESVVCKLIVNSG